MRPPPRRTTAACGRAALSHRRISAPARRTAPSSAPPVAPTATPSFSIKGKFAVRARFTGNVGIYHLQGCRSYAGLTKPDRWFCSEDDAKAAGFRRAFNCRAGRTKWSALHLHDLIHRRHVLVEVGHDPE